MNEAEKQTRVVSELVRYGRIVQDGDDSVSAQERERRFNLYVKLVEALNGDEGVPVARALLRSIQAVHDYGAYQTTIGKLVFGFPADVVAQAVLAEIPRLIDELPDWAGDILSVLTRARGRSEDLVAAFNLELSRSSGAEHETLQEFIRAQEQRGGWLEDKPGVLAP